MNGLLRTVRSARSAPIWAILAVCACAGEAGRSAGGKPAASSTPTPPGTPGSTGGNAGLGGPGTGTGASPGTVPTTSNTTPVPPVPAGLSTLGPTAIPRITRTEYVASIKSLLNIDVGGDVSVLPPDSFTPFDNAADYQSPSSTLIQGLRAVAEIASDKAMQTPEQKAALVGCTPAAANDEACFRQFVASFSLKALHRPLSDAEVGAFVAFLPFAQQGNDFYIAAKMVVQAVLQNMEFVYRTEIGSPVTGETDLVSLTDWELGARLSYLVWGETPDAALLDSVAKGTLGTPAGFRTEALRLLSDPRGVSRIQRFHAMSFGYEQLPHSASLSLAFRTETDALVKRVVFDTPSPWFNLFQSTDTYINQELATLYGMAAPASGYAWTPYPDATRTGLLSQGSILSNGAKGNDTSPTRRGKYILERMLCSPVPPPPPGVANTDQPPPPVAGANCKKDRYAAHSTGTCAGCHGQMDPIGFGLENYDLSGKRRETDEGRPECTITGAGQLPTGTTFNGPGELSKLLVADDRLGQCLAQRLYEFTVQRPLQATTDDAALKTLREHFDGTQFSLRDALLDWLGSGTFRYRRIEPFKAQVVP